jgi:hypothetical protein
MTTVKLTRHGPRACKHVLPSSDEVIAGYRTLHTQEEIYNRKAIEAMPDAVKNWYGHLTLYDRVMRREYEWPKTEPDDDYWSWKARLNLAIVAESTAKLVLDASLAGYYSQAYGMLRHMVETWEQMVYLRLIEEPGTGMRWFTPNGIQPARVPKQDTIRKALRKIAKAGKLPWLTHNLNAIEAMVERLNKGAHPGSFTMVQASTEMPGFQQLGAKFDRELLGDCLSLGTAAMALLLCEIEWLFPDSSMWQDEFKSLQKERNEWFRAAYGEDSSVDVLDAPPPTDAPTETP